MMPFVPDLKYNYNKTYGQIYNKLINNSNLLRRDLAPENIAGVFFPQSGIWIMLKVRMNC